MDRSRRIERGSFARDDMVRRPALRRWPAAVAALVAALSGVAPLAAQDLASFERRTTVHVLANGWTFILVERPVAPVFSFATYVNVGSVREAPGTTGLAHMFEHMAFKGTPRVGTSDYEAERKALAEVEAAYQAYQKERLSLQPDSDRLDTLLAQFKAKQAEATRYVVSNEFGDIVESEGGVDLNAFTASDYTGYFYSLPANKFELFAYLESERFLHPVFREFYEERDVVQEERRMRYESQPFGRLLEQWVAAAFVSHPYKDLGIGAMSDLQSLTITDAEAFYRTYYVPSNMVTAIVGHVDAETAIPVLETYFGRIPSGPRPEELRTVEPPQIAEKVVILPDPSQPLYIESYHRPGVDHPDQAVYDAIDDILTRGRTSRLYRRLVRDKRLAVSVQSFSGFPGEKYPHLWGVFAVPARGVANEQVQAEIRAELERLKGEPVTAEELEKFRTRAEADLIRSLASNFGLADALTRNQTLFGDWRELFRYLDKLRAVTAADIRRVAREAFVDTNRTVAMIVTREPEAAGEEQEEEEEEGEAEGGAG